MNAPDLSRTYETFVRLPRLRPETASAWWQSYLNRLRLEVTPMVAGLVDAGVIGWYSFLIHDRSSGVPADPGIDGAFLHLRFELCIGRDESELREALPPDYLWTRRIVFSGSSDSMDGLDVSALKGADASEGWRVLGETSAWTLSMLAGHDPTKAVPVRNVAQLLHYLGNQLGAGIVGIPMP